MTFGGMEDFVIRKSDGTPSYNFAVVVDDLELGVTHVIRGEEHLQYRPPDPALRGARRDRARVHPSRRHPRS